MFFLAKEILYFCMQGRIDYFWLKIEKMLCGIDIQLQYKSIMKAPHHRMCNIITLFERSPFFHSYSIIRSTEVRFLHGHFFYFSICHGTYFWWLVKNEYSSLRATPRDYRVATAEYCLPWKMFGEMNTTYHCQSNYYIVI